MIPHHKHTPSRHAPDSQAHGRYVLAMLIWGVFGLGSCQSDKKQQELKSQHVSAADLGSESGAGHKSSGEDATHKNPLCAEKPTLKACCEALIPKCNECREENRRTTEAWQRACLKEAATLPSCEKAPVFSCCQDESEACRACRDKALQDLQKWKERCANIEAHPCDRRPPVMMCCQAMIPSCLQCKARNDRILEDWNRRCGPKQEGKP